MLEAYVEGINEYLIAAAARGEVPLPARARRHGSACRPRGRPTDVVAAVSTVRALFGAGGGAELNNAAVLAGLQRRLRRRRRGRAIYEDFRNRDNADGPVHTTKRFPYHMPRSPTKLDPRANARATRRRATPGLVAPARGAGDQVQIRYERLKLDTPLGASTCPGPARCPTTSWSARRARPPATRS